MPEVTAAERLARAAPIDPARVRVGLDAAARAAAAAPDAAITLRMLGARPVYVFGAAGTTVFTDDGSVLAAVTADDALALGRVFLGPGSAPLSYGELVALPDQWTLQNRAHLPLHRLRAGDVAGTDLYVSSVTGEMVMQTTRRSRGLPRTGPVGRRSSAFHQQRSKRWGGPRRQRPSPTSCGWTATTATTGTGMRRVRCQYCASVRPIA